MAVFSREKNVVEFCELVERGSSSSIDHAAFTGSWDELESRESREEPSRLAMIIRMYSIVDLLRHWPRCYDMKASALMSAK